MHGPRARVQTEGTVPVAYSTHSRVAPGAHLRGALCRPGPVNQDNYFVWEAGDGQNAVVIVLDGHGRELGQMASAVAKRSLRGSLCHLDALARLRREPQRTMREAFDVAHEAVKGAFRDHYERRGWRVREHEEGASGTPPRDYFVWLCAQVDG